MSFAHLHLGSKDVASSQAFYEKYFQFKKHQTIGFAVFLIDPQGFRLTIDLVDEVPDLPSWFHFGFVLPHKNDVTRVYEAMTQAKVHIAKPLVEYKERDQQIICFYCFDPDGYKIEVRAVL